MTVLAARGAGADPSSSGGDTIDPSVGALVLRLREAADQMVAFSQAKTLLRDAASMIERLEVASRVNRAGSR